MLISTKLERIQIGVNFHDEYFLGYKLGESTVLWEKVSKLEYDIGCKKLDEMEALANE